MREPSREGAVAPLLTSEAREGAIARLSTAFAHDVLSLEEFERRTTAAYRAKSSNELEHLLADLPVPRASGGDPVVAFQPIAPRIAAVFANVERGGVVIVPARLEIRALFGNVELDLSEARFEPGVTEISIRSMFGNVEIRLPRGAQVENHGSAMLGSFTSHRSGSMEPSAVRILVTGRAVLANVELTAGRPAEA